jgi:hypothetical protein
MTLDTDKLHDDLLRHCNYLDKTQTEVCRDLGLSRTIFQVLKRGGDIYSSTLIKLINEMNKDLKEYLV